ncbi:ClpB protein [hydrothermal vent metagenome]|uniref:ClpB protein n=1 Tax=hydrothermal vent metagenome TaxID=652676 RepID=A0A3B0XV89_9ZZZZ
MKRIAIDPAVQLGWALANAEACLSGNDHIEPEHFVLALLNIIDDAFQQEASNMGIPPQGIEALLEFAVESRLKLGLDDRMITMARRALRKSLHEGHSPGPMVMLHRTDACRSLFRKAGKRAAASGSDSLTLDFLLEEIASDFPKEVAACFPVKAREETGKSQFKQGHSQEIGWQSINDTLSDRSLVMKTPVINTIGRDLTALAREGRLPDVVSRQQEMKALARFLSRTAKRGVMLVGKAGVGKTAVIEGLAQRIAENNVPEFLRSVRIIQLNVSDLISETRYRGDMEKRLQDIILEAETDPNLILFIDEVHLIMQSVGGGASELANILKPALSRDSLRVIGATTDEEFERYVRPDGAFMRRFQVLQVSEPALDECIIISNAWVKRIEKYQQVKFEADVVENAVSLAADLLTDRNLPDSAIDLLENAATFVKVSSLSTDTEILKKEKPIVSVQLIHNVLQEIHGISVDMLNSFDANRISVYLNEKISGQGKAVSEIIETLESVQLTIERENKPVAVFLFTGPSGIGKTFTAECLSEVMFGDINQGFLRINMSELKEQHDIARLIGAPPGFIGHDQEPVLFKFVSGSPQGLILLDEMEKSHPEIQDYFLQIFDKGTARNSHGRSVDFRHTVFVMTCNIWTEGAKSRNIGFVEEKEPVLSDAENDLKTALKDSFRPEFIARIDRCVRFRELNIDDLGILLSRKFKCFSDKIKMERGVNVVLDDAECRNIVLEFDTPKEGVRGLMRAVERLLFTPLLKYIGTLSNEKYVTVKLNGDKPVFQASISTN